MVVAHICVWGFVAWAVWCRGQDVLYPAQCSALCSKINDPAVLDFHQRLLQALSQLLSRYKSSNLAHVVLSDALIALRVEVGGGSHTKFVRVSEAVGRSGRHPAQQAMGSYESLKVFVLLPIKGHQGPRTLIQCF